MVALEHEWPLAAFAAAEITAGDFSYFDVFVDDFAVEYDAREPRVGDFFAILELCRSEVDFEFLSLSRRASGVDAGHGRAVNRADIARADLVFAVAIQDLNFVVSHEVDARVRALGNHHLNR